MKLCCIHGWYKGKQAKLMFIRHALEIILNVSNQYDKVVDKFQRFPYSACERQAGINTHYLLILVSSGQSIKFGTFGPSRIINNNNKNYQNYQVNESCAEK
jgi:hypothetical protein